MPTNAANRSIHIDAHLIRLATLKRVLPIYQNDRE